MGIPWSEAVGVSAYPDKLPWEYILGSGHTVYALRYLLSNTILTSTGGGSRKYSCFQGPLKTE
jgi:hypothetical protein